MQQENGLPLKHKILKIFLYLSKRAIVFYLVVLAASFLIVDYKKVTFGVKIRYLNKIMPDSFYDLADFAEGQKKLTPERMLMYTHFYEKVVTFFPERADAFGMLGFCYYYLGRIDQAKIAYQRAAELNPDFFWFHYNLGLIAYNSNRYDEAVHFFNKALVVEQDSTLNYIKSSKVIYRSILLDHQDFAQKTTMRLKKAYHEAHDLLQQSVFLEKNAPPAGTVLKIRALKIF